MKVANVKLVGRVAASDGPVAIHLRVRGRRVRVRRGRFVARVHLRRGMNRIRLIAAAPGYPRTHSQLLVRFRPEHRAAPSLVAQANAVCQRAQGQALLLDWNTVSSSSALRLLNQLGRLVGRQAARLAAIRPPRSKAAPFAAYVGIERTRQVLIPSLVAAIRARSAPAVRHLVSQFRALNIEEERLVRQLNFDQCQTLLLPTS